MRSVGAIILAAGSGSRMGRTKQLLRIDGQSLVRRVVRAAVDAVRSDPCPLPEYREREKLIWPVVVVTGADEGAVSKEISDLPVKIEFNSNWLSGIGSSIRCGLSALLATDPNIEALMILLCDQPHLSSKILEDLAAAWSGSQNPMAACGYSNTIGPPCCFARSMFDQLSQIGDNDGAKRVFLSDLSKVTVMPWPDGGADLDTPEDLNRLNERLGREDSEQLL